MKELIYNPDPEPVLEPLFERHSLDGKWNGRICMR